MTFTCDGDVAPGLSAGILTIDDELPMGATSVLAIELGGLTAGVEHDQLQVLGTASLSGTLRVSLIDEFTSAFEDAFTILTATAVDGTSDPVEAPATIDETAPWTLDPVSTTDPDIPANVFTYALVSGPEGASVDEATGRITWLPTEAQGPGVYPVTVSVTDDNPDAVNEKNLFSEATVSVTVKEVNRAPDLSALADATIHADGRNLRQIPATDPDIPENALTYELVSGPAGCRCSPVGQESQVREWRSYSANFSTGARSSVRTGVRLGRTGTWPRAFMRWKKVGRVMMR